MKGWRLVVLLCTALLCEPVRPQEKWSKPEAADKRIDDWVPITATCPSCQKNLEPNEPSGIDEIGSLLNPPAVPSGRAFNFNGKQSSLNRITSGEPYEITTPQPPPSSGQFFSQQQVPKIPQPAHFPVPFLGQQNPFQTRFSGFPNFQPQFTFIPQPQIQPSQKEKKVTFPDSPFIQQQNKGSVQLVYVPIEALQRQKPRFQADKPIPQQSQLDVKTQSPFETGKLKFQRPPQPFEPPRFLTPQQFEQDANRFAPPPSSFEQDTGRFPSTSQLFDQGKTNFKEQRPEFLPQNEQPAAPQSYQFVEDIRNPSSTFFQFNNRFQKPSFEETKPKESKPQGQQTFVSNFDATRQESTQNVVSNFETNRPRPDSQQHFLPNFQETRPKPELRPQNVQPNFQETRPRQEPLSSPSPPPPQFVPKFEEPKLEPQQQFINNFQENGPRQEQPPQFIPKFEEPKLEPQQQFISNFQENRPRQQQPPQFIPKFEEPKLEPTQQFISNFQENRPRQEQSKPPKFTPKLEEPKLDPQQQFISNFQENRPRQEQSKPPKFTPKFEEPKLDPQQQFIPNFQENKPRQEQPQPPQFIPKFEEPKLEPQQQFIPNFQENRPIQEQPQSPQFIPKFEEPKLEPQPQFNPNFQDIRQQEIVQQSFIPNFESLRPSPTPTPQQTFDLPGSSEQVIQAPSTPFPPPHQPPLSVYMEKRLDNRINEVLTILKEAKTIPVLDTIGNRSPKVFVGPSDLDAPRGYVKFELPYLSSLDITKIDSMSDRLPFFVAPLNFKPPFGYAKIPFPPPHIGSVVVSSKSPAVATSTEFVPFTLTSQLPTEVNSLQPSLSSTTQREIQKVQPSTESTITTTRRNRQRKPLHRGSLTSFSSTTSVNGITERQNDQFTTPTELQRLPENSSNDQQQFLETTTTALRQKFSRKPVEQQTSFETTQAPIQQQQSFFESTPTPARPKFLRKPVEQPTVIETTQQPQQFENPQQQFENTQQQFENPQQQFFADQQNPQTQQDYIGSQPQLTQHQSSQQAFFDNQPQFLDNPPQAIQEQILNTPQPLADINNQDISQQQFIPSSTEKQIIKNFQQIQPLSQYQVGNNFLNQQQSSTEQIQSTSSIPQTVSNEPETVAPTDIPKLRQRLSYYDKLLLSSTQPPIETTRAENVIEPSEKPRERPKLRPRQRLTTTKKPTTESLTSEVVPEQVSETSTQRFNPLKRRRPTTTTTTEQTETTRSSLRSRTTQASRSEFVRSRSRRPTTTTTTTTTTEATRTEQTEDANDVHASSGQDEQKKIEEAASFWNEPVTIQQSHSYELDTTNSQLSTTNPDGKFDNVESSVSNDFAKEKYGNEKKAHDPNNEKKTPGRRGHWVRVRVKKPQDSLDTAESQNSLGPLSANAIRELATKPTTEFGVQQTSSSVPAETTATTTAESVTVTPTPTNFTTEVTTTETVTTTTTTTASPPTTISDYTEGVTTEEHPAETTDVIPSTSAKTSYPDDEQDEAFQRNLADMLAKFIGGGNEPQQQQQQPPQIPQQQEPEEEEQQQQQQETTVTTAEESTAETLYADAEPTVTPPAVTELPVVPVTSTTTKVSMETEICYRGRCVKSKKNKQTTDLVSEP